ncbi:MAG: Fe-S cluster assembly protein SufD [Cellvibrio sp.]
MSEFQQHTLAIAQRRKPLAWFAAEANGAMSDWQNAAWPNRKTEHFKYLPINSLQKDFPVADAAQTAIDAGSLDLIPLDAIKLVFIDGVFSQKDSSELVNGLSLFSQVDSTKQTWIKENLNRLIDKQKHIFTTLNTALLNEGVVLEVADNQQLDKPLYIVHVATRNNISAPRLLVSLGKNTRAEVIEHYVSSDLNHAVVNTVSELFVGENSTLNHYRLNFEEEASRHLGAVHVELARASQLRGFTLTLGSRFNRIDYQVNHRGPGAHLDLQGLYVPKNNQVADVHTNVCHWVPHCTSNEVFRGIVGDSALAVFNGRIYIHPDAQKTLAELSNKNMLTSHKAEINTKPELEIYADDVKCAHGATVSQLNDDARFYLQSRGLSKTEAEVMLSFGFVNELLEQIQNPVIHDYLLPRLAERFGRDQSLMLAASE